MAAVETPFPSAVAFPLLSLGLAVQMPLAWAGRVLIVNQDGTLSAIAGADGQSLAISGDLPAFVDVPDLVQQAINAIPGASAVGPMGALQINNNGAFGAAGATWDGTLHITPENGGNPGIFVESNQINYAIGAQSNGEGGAGFFYQTTGIGASAVFIGCLSTLIYLANNDGTSLVIKDASDKNKLVLYDTGYLNLRLGQHPNAQPMTVPGTVVSSAAASGNTDTNPVILGDTQIGENVLMNDGDAVYIEGMILLAANSNNKRIEFLVNGTNFDSGTLTHSGGMLIYRATVIRQSETELLVYVNADEDVSILATKATFNTEPFNVSNGFGFGWRVTADAAGDVQLMAYRAVFHPYYAP